MAVAFNKDKILGVLYKNDLGVRVKLLDELINLENSAKEAYEKGEMEESAYKKIIKEINDTKKLLFERKTTVIQVHDKIETISKLIKEATGAVVPTLYTPDEEELNKRTLKAYEWFLWFIADPTEQNWNAFDRAWNKVPNEYKYKEKARVKIDGRVQAMLVGNWDTALAGMSKNKAAVIKDALIPHMDLLENIFKKGNFYDNAKLIKEAYAGLQDLILKFSSANSKSDYETAWAPILSSTKNSSTMRGAYNLAVRYTYGLYNKGEGKETAIDMLKSMWTGAEGDDELGVLNNIGLQIIRDKTFLNNKTSFKNKYGDVGEKALAKMDLMGQYSFLTWTLPAIEAAGNAAFSMEQIDEYYNNPVNVDPDEFTKEMIDRCGRVAMATGYAGQNGLFGRSLPRILSYYNEYDTIISILETIEATAEGIQSHYDPISSRVMKYYCEVQVPTALDASLEAFLGKAEAYLLKSPSQSLGQITPGTEQKQEFEMEDPVTKWERILKMRAGVNITPLDIRLPQNFSLFEGETYMCLTPDDVRARPDIDVKSAREIYRDVFSLASLSMFPKRNYWAARPPPGSYFDLIARLAQVNWQRVLLGIELTTFASQIYADGIMEWSEEKTNTLKENASIEYFGPRSSIGITMARGETAIEELVDETGQVNDARMAKLVAQDLASDDWSLDNLTASYTTRDITYYTPEGDETKVTNKDIKAMLDLYHKQTDSDIVMFAEMNAITGYYNVYAYYLQPASKEGGELVWVRAGVFRLSEEQATQWFAGYTTTSKDVRVMLEKGQGLSGFILGLQTDRLGGAVIYDKKGKINLGTVMDIVLESSTTGNLNNGVVYLSTFWDTQGNLPNLTQKKFKGAAVAYAWEKDVERGWVLGGIGAGTADKVVSFGWQKRDIGVDAAWLERMNEMGKKKGRTGWGGYLRNDEFYSFIMSNFLYSLTGTEGAVGAIEFKNAKFLGNPRLQVSWFHANKELKHYQFQLARSAYLEKVKEENDILKEIDYYRSQQQEGLDGELDGEIKKAERELLIVRKEKERWMNLANRLFLAAAGEQYWTAQYIVGGLGLESALGMSKDYLAMLANTFVEFDEKGASANFGYRTDVRLKTGGGKIIMPLGDAVAAVQGGAWTSTYGNGMTLFGGVVGNPYSKKGMGAVGGMKKEWISGDVTAPGRTDVTSYETGVFGWWGGPLESMAKGTRKEVYVLMKYENGVFTPHDIDMSGEKWKKWNLEPGWVVMSIDPLTGKQFIFGLAGLFGTGEIQRMEGLFTELEETEIGVALRLENVDVEKDKDLYGKVSLVYQTLKPKGAAEAQRYGILWMAGKLGIVIPIG